MKHSEKTPPTVDFLYFAYNDTDLLLRSIDLLVDAIERAQWSAARILVVNDGSTDGMAERLAAYTRRKITVISQPNMGRLVATQTAVSHATAEFVVTMTVRVFMYPDSLTYLKKQLMEHPERRVWNCHIDMVRKSNPQAQFWYVMTYMAWRRYLQHPKLVSFDEKDYDYYPKGTGAFVCDRKLLKEAYQHLDSIYDNKKFASDDTSLIRYIATQQKIWLSPEYGGSYESRSTLRKFYRHTFFRGIFLLDSYFRPGTRYYLPLIAYFIAVPLGLAVAVLFPWLLLSIPLVMVLAGLFLLSRGVKIDDVLGFLTIAPLFGIVYSAGMYRGLAALLRTKLQKEQAK